MTVFLKKLHKWVSLLIGLQVLLWLLSGLMLSLIDPARVSGEKWVQERFITTQPLHSGRLLEPHELNAGQLDGALSISLELARNPPVYRLITANGTSLINASDGSTMLTTAQDARILARQDFSGDGKVISVLSGMAPDLETRNHMGEYWRVNFSDKAHSSLYISVSTGEILERRNNYWRVFDFFWMLHIMDYSGHEDINNTLVIIVALISIWLGISGFLLLFSSFHRRDFYFLNILAKRPW